MGGLATVDYTVRLNEKPTIHAVKLLQDKNTFENNVLNVSYIVHTV